MNAWFRAGSVLSLLAWLLPGATVHGVVLHVAAEHTVHTHGAAHQHAAAHAHAAAHEHALPHEHAVVPHSHPAEHGEHPQDHHEQILQLLATHSTVASRADLALRSQLASPAALQCDPLPFAAAYAVPARLPEPVPRDRPGNIPPLHPILLI